MAETLDPYEVLEVTRDAGLESIKASYRRLSKQFHPDVCQDDSAAASQRRLNEAYEILSDPQKRAVFDATGNWSQAMGALLPAELTLMEIFGWAIGRSENGENIVHVVTAKIGRDITQLAEGKRQRDRALKILRAGQKRVKFKGARTNLLAKVYATKIALLEAEIQQADAALVTAREMLELLRAYDFEMVARIQPSVAWTFTASSLFGE